jgi:glycosyltransferase involved in cell wall biosynthesis
MSLPKGTSVVIASRCAFTTFNFRRQLIAELQRAGAEVVACGAGGDGYEEALRAAGVRFIPLPLASESRNPLADLKYLVCCWRLLRAIRPQVMHAFTVKPVIYCTIAAALARVPVRVAMITGLGYAFTSSGAFLRVLTVGLYRLALRYSDLVYFQNPDDRDEFLRRRIVSSNKIRMISGSGVDTEHFAPATVPAVKPGPGTAFVMVARALREKGVLEYLQAAAIVRRYRPHVSFVLVGDVDVRNPSSLERETVSRAAAGSGVTWVGHVRDTRPFLAAADIVVLASYREGTPMALLEAAAMAKPLIATRVPGCVEVVRDGFNGWLAAPRDGEALASTMLQAIAERDCWGVYGENSRRLATDRFDVRLVCSQIMGDYDELVRHREA